MTDRRRLPNRKFSETFPVECNGLRYTATISQFPDGRLAEIFPTNHKSGSQANSAARDAAVTGSIALQYRAPLDVIRRALMRDSHGIASSPLGAALDAIIREQP